MNVSQLFLKLSQSNTFDYGRQVKSAVVVMYIYITASLFSLQLLICCYYYHYLSKYNNHYIYVQHSPCVHEGLLLKMLMYSKILCIKSIVLPLFQVRHHRDFFLGGCLEITKVGCFILCTFQGSGISLQV